MRGLADKRTKAKESSLTTGEAIQHFATADGPAHSSDSLIVCNDSHQENDHRQSTSSKKLHKFQENTEVDHTDSTVWTFLEIGQLNRLLCDIACPECGSSLSVSLGTHLGLAREMTLKGSDCDYKQQQFTSPRLGKAERQNDGFEVNSHGILFTHEIGLGYASLNKLCAVYGMPNMCEFFLQKKDKAVCNTIDAAAVATLETVVDLVKAAYMDTYPLGTEVRDEHDNEPQHSLHFDDDDNDWNVDDSTPWIDVTFDGTWHKRGFTSMYGVAVVIDILTGSVIDYEVLSKYCHACGISKSKDMTDDQ